MGISINVGAKQDYSFLFQSMSGSNGSSNLNFLSDYAAIKNGSYAKLMKAYYGQMSSTSKKTSSNSSSTTKTNTSSNSISTASDSTKTLSNIEKSADALKSSSDKLLATGSKSLFTKKNITTTDENGVEKTTNDYDVNAIYQAVSTFVDDYNNVIGKAGDANSTTIQNRLSFLTNTTSANKNLLSKVGITINSDKTLSLDEDAFKSADMTTVKSLFNGSNSYAYNVSSQASMIDYAATRESAKANTYTGSGTYSNSYSSGSIWDYGF